MSTEIILIGVLVLVFALDFLIKRIKNNKEQNNIAKIGEIKRKLGFNLGYFGSWQIKLILSFVILLASLLFIANPFKSLKGNLNKIIITELPVSCIQISPNTKFIAIADDTDDPLGYQNLNEEFKISILNSSDFTEILTLSGHTESIESVNFSLDSKKLISSDKSGEIKVWDLSSGKELKSIKTGKWVHNAKFSNSGNEFIAIQGFEKLALIYDVNGDLISKLNVRNQINAFEYDPNTNLIFFGCHKEIQVWSLATKKLIYKKPFDVFLCMSFNHDYSQLAIGTSNEEIKIITPDLEEIKSLKGHFKPVLSLSFSFDNKKLASSSSDQTARVWDLNKGSEILQLTNEHKGRVSSVEFISKNNEFMTGGENKELKLWK